MGDDATGAVAGAGSGAAIGTMFGPGYGTAIGAGIGGLMGLFGANQKQKQAASQNKVEAAKALTNPWLGMTPQTITAPSSLGGVTTGALSGLQVAQGIQKANANPAAPFQQNAAASGAALTPQQLAMLNSPNALAYQSPWLGQMGGQ
jgi:hypothetical protein